MINIYKATKNHGVGIKFTMYIDTTYIIRPGESFRPGIKVILFTIFFFIIFIYIPIFIYLYYYTVFLPVSLSSSDFLVIIRAHGLSSFYSYSFIYMFNAFTVKAPSRIFPGDDSGSRRLPEQRPLFLLWLRAKNL